MSLKSLLEAAKVAQNNSYSPYSHFKVGSAILLENGKIFSGTNIENASYGATVCAERVAIWKALSEHPKSKIKAVLVITEKAWPPCGQCRQVIAEFGTPTTEIHIASNANGVVKTLSFKELFPDGFSPDHINQK
jgi:cytidine deaminase